MALTPGNVVPKGRTLAWIWLGILLASYGVYCAFLFDRAIALSKDPVVTSVYDASSPRRLPYVGICFNDESLSYADGFQLGSTQQARCFNAGGPAHGATSDSKRGPPEALPVKHRNCDIDIFRDDIQTRPLVVQYDPLPTSPGQPGRTEGLLSNCRVEAFYFKNRLGDCASCLGFNLSNNLVYRANGSTESQIYMGLHYPDGSPSSHTVVPNAVESIPFTVYLIETEDAAEARASNLSFREMDTYSSFVLNLNSSARVTIHDQQRRTFRYTKTQHFLDPVVKPLPINPGNFYVDITSSSDYFFLNFTTSSKGIEVLVEQNPWLALVSSLGGAWTVVFSIFGLFFVYKEGMEPKPSHTWINRRWISKLLVQVGAWLRCHKGANPYGRTTDEDSNADKVPNDVAQA